MGTSACLLGDQVRYNGGHCRDKNALPQLGRYVDFVKVCPEVGAGLGAPRESLRLVGSPGAPRLVGGHTGTDRTRLLREWSARRVETLAAMDLDGYVLKKGSPSCGMERVRVYGAPDKAPSYKGVGVFARALRERLPRLAVEEEGRLTDPGLREHFFTRVFASFRWRSFASASPTARDLAAFHTRHDLLLRAHDAEAAADLSRLATEGGNEPNLDAYGDGFLDALATRPTRESQADVLWRLLDEAARLTKSERGDLEMMIDEYLRGFVPLAVPARMLLHHLRAQDAAAADQVWFAPWPEGIRLRSQITR